VVWTGLSAADATWMDLEEFKRLYPDFQLEDELIVQGGRDVMWGIPYVRRKKKAQAQAGAGKDQVTAPTN
jgi:hypothetical protein